VIPDVQKVRGKKLWKCVACGDTFKQPLFYCLCVLKTIKAWKRASRKEKKS